MKKSEIRKYLGKIGLENFHFAFSEYDSGNYLKIDYLRYYVIKYNGKSYPPAFILRTGYKNATNKDLPDEVLSHLGDNKEPFQVIREFGFEVQNIEGRKKYYVKRLLENELGYRKGVPSTGETFMVSKNAAWHFFPPLGVIEKNDNRKLLISSKIKGDFHSVTYTYHNDIYFGGSRNEFRIYLTADLLSDFRTFIPNDLVLISSIPDSDNKYELIHLKEGDKEFKFYNDLLGMDNHYLTDNFTGQTTQNMSNSKPQFPINQILYGPPGTGKTYTTVNEALKIIDQEFYENNKDHRDVLIKKFNSLMYDENENPEGQIIFTTFHQSMSYEDFIEGIKPTIDTDVISYEIKDGILKVIADKAKNSRKTNFHESYSNFIKSINENSNDYVMLKTVRGNEYRVNVNSNNNLNLFTSSEIKKQGTLSKKKLESFCNGETNVFDAWEGYAAGVVNHLKEKFQLVNEDVNHFKNYVLVIDEINRGNVSAVFGELITLIEDDKRIGKDNELTVILPYSKDKFGVPSNLYIIGTMNSADRSVEALDTALRRRFSFKEMLPKPELIATEGKADKGMIDTIDLVKLLITINERIEALVDRDHTIGHAFFMDVNSIDSLKNVFANKVIPLLQEYFYGDYAKMEMVIGPDFFNSEKRKKKVTFAIQNEDIEIPTGKYELINILDKKFDFVSAINRLLNRKTSEIEVN